MTLAFSFRKISSGSQKNLDHSFPSYNYKLALAIRRMRLRLETDVGKSIK